MGIKKALDNRKKECTRCWVALKREEVEIPGRNIEIDTCEKCGGIWLDENELGKLLRDRRLNNYLSKNIGTKSRSKIICPRCGGLMDTQYADEIEVDTCLTCHGIWLDAGELEELKKKSAAGFKEDEIDKAAERYEESILSRRTLILNRFMRKIMK